MSPPPPAVSSPSRSSSTTPPPPARRPCAARSTGSSSRSRSSETAELRLQERPIATSPSVRAVIGTAGHVDHGKTTLVGSLTGIDTDRLAEEKARGISIELGFAWLDLPEPVGGRVAVVDVPGHERFVRQMIAGAAGVDLVLLVVAADEGVMPQTREHLDICGLLGVRRGAVVVTKVDLVDPDWLELVLDDVRAGVAGTFLEGAPIALWSVHAPASTDRVKALVADLVADTDTTTGRADRVDRPFKLAIDRAFTLRGFGVIVTGTTASGELAVGESVIVQPEGLTARVRQLQLHGEPVARVGPGVRAAVNLQGVDHHAIHRGAVLTSPGGLAPTSMFDATFTALPRLAQPVPGRARVLVHVGTAQIEGTLAVIGAAAARPGERVFAQLRLSQPTAVLPGEPFVLRGFTVLPGYGKTLGGGRVLAPATCRHRASSPAARALLEALAEGPTAAVAGWVAHHGEAGRPRAALAAELPWPSRSLAAAVSAAGLIEAGGTLWAPSVADDLVDRVREILAAHHAARPTRPGLREDELRTRVRGDLSPELFGLAVERAVAAGALGRTSGHLHAPGFVPSRPPALVDALARVRAGLAAAGLTPPRVIDLPTELALASELVDDALAVLVDDGEVIRINRELAYPRAQLDHLVGRVRDHFRHHDTLDTATFKELTGASRKWAIPLGEYLDRLRLTVRVGDVRRLRVSS